MKKVYFLASCSTCQRIMKELNIDDSFQKREIKSAPLTEQELDEMKALSGSYASLFSKRSQKLREYVKDDNELTETRCRELILKEYTFLKRPVILVNGSVFVGNLSKTVESAKRLLGE